MTEHKITGRWVCEFDYSMRQHHGIDRSWEIAYAPFRDILKPLDRAIYHSNGKPT